MAFLLPALIAGFGLILAGRVTAQTFTTLHSFTAGTGIYYYSVTNTDGAAPRARLLLSGNTLYGTTFAGGGNGSGTVFAINTDGTGFTNLYSFTATDLDGINSDGAGPNGLILSGNLLYGSAGGGGNSGSGTVFAVNTDGTGFTNLYNFTATSRASQSDPYINSDGADPNGLILSGNTLFGTTGGGGNSGVGTVFSVNTDGTSFTTLYTFTGSSDGSRPSNEGLILSGNTLYGTTRRGGSYDNGTVFAVNSDGTGFTNLHLFGGYPSEGSLPAGLVLSGNTLYGTTFAGGGNGSGTVFAINTDGTGFTNLHIFDNGSSDGADPDTGLIVSGNILYGTAFRGGSADRGTLFTVNSDGTGFTKLYSFTAIGINSTGVFTNSDGANPEASLLLSGNTLYGTASGGGSSGNGTVFSLSFRPQLTITPSGTNVILTWLTNSAGFNLQSTTNLGSSAVWALVSPAPVVVNNQNTVTNPISGTRKFYRLIDP